MQSKIIGYIEWLVSLGFIMDNELVIDLVLKSLLNYWANFIMNLNLSEKEKTFKKLLSFLKTAEQNLRKTANNNVLMVKAKAAKVCMGNDKSKSKA